MTPASSLATFTILDGVALAPLTTLELGGPARHFVELLRDKGLTDVLVVIGGIIPDVDIPRLNEMGITGIFLPGTPMAEIVDFITRHARSRVEQA